MSGSCSRILCFILTLECLGCGGGTKGRPPASEQTEGIIFAGGAAAAAVPGEGHSPDAIRVKLPSQDFERKIVYTGTVEAVVQDFDTAATLFQALVKQYQGIIAQSEIIGAAGTQRTGHWKIRVPVAQFEPFMQAVSKLGELEKNKIDSDDKTEEFYDLETRIKNKKLEENRLLNHMKDTTAKLADILAVEKELSRVREEIERLEGRRDLLKSLTSLTTVEITLREIRNYKLPTAPSFGMRIERTFADSWSALQDFGAGLVLFVAALAPWLPLLLLIIVPVYLLARRWLRQRRQQLVPVLAGPVPSVEG